MTDLIERLQHCIVSEAPGSWRKETMREAADRLAALEAEASEGERRGLERAIEAIEGTSHVVNVEGDMQAWCDGYDFAEEAAVKAIRALIPEALAQRELGSSEANQISTTEVGLQEAPAEGWQPISSAPKDGSEIILHDRGTVGTGFYSEAPEARRAEAGWFWEDDRGSLLIAKNADPTHWMPLPSPPQDREEQ